MSHCRVVQKPDGSVTVIRPGLHSRRPDEDELVWLDRVFTAHMESRGWIGRPFVDMDVSNLPPERTKRNKWRLNPSNSVFVDDSVPDTPHPRQELVDRIERAGSVDELKQLLKEYILR